jgi:ATP-dependent DNA ligase
MARRSCAAGRCRDLRRAPPPRHGHRGDAVYAFDLLEIDGEDLRALPLSDRKKHRARLLGGRRLDIVLSDHTDEDSATI